MPATRRNETSPSAQDDPMATAAPVRVFLIADIHHQDVRGNHTLSFSGMAEAINEYEADLVVNLNDTVAKPEKLRSLPGCSPEESYRAYWLKYGQELRARLRAPTIDVGLHRDLSIWDEIATNPPHGTEVVGGIRVLWLAPEQSVTAISTAQLDWAVDQIEQHPAARWLIASHAPVRFPSQRGRKHCLDGSGRLYEAATQHAAAAVFAGAHLHLSHAPPTHEGHCLTMVSGAMNVIGGNAHSYGRRVTFESAGVVRVEVIHLDERAVEESWEFFL